MFAPGPLDLATLFTGSQPLFTAGFLSTNFKLFTDSLANDGQQLQVDFGGDTIFLTAQFDALGEPGGLAVLSLGLLGLAGLRRRRNIS